MSPSSGWVQKSVVGSGLDPGRGEGAACFAGDCLVDHLTVNRSDAVGVLVEDRAGSIHGLGAWRQRGIDRADLRGVNGGLGAEAERHRGGYFLLQAAFIVKIEEWGVDRHNPRESACGAQSVIAPRSAAISAAPSIRPNRRGVAVPIASTAASPCALSIRPTSLVSFLAEVNRRSRI